MNEDYFKEQAARLRNMASMADPFAKRRLLDLREIQGRRFVRRPTPLPSVAMDRAQQPEDQNSGGDTA